MAKTSVPFALPGPGMAGRDLLGRRVRACAMAWIRRAAFAFLQALALAGVVAAQAAPSPAERAVRVEEAFRFWLTQQGMTQGTLAVIHAGAVIHRTGVGRAADEPVEIASLGKALTAVCLDALVNEGRARYDMTLGAVLGAGGVLAGVTLDQLVTHSAGLSPDSTQDAMWHWLDDPGPRLRQATEMVMARGDLAGAPGAFSYNNENYALLGAVIAEISGQGYREACRARVLADYPSLAPSPRTGAFDAWGGWLMSAADYARFLARHYGPDSVIGADPRSRPHVLVAGGAHYGMGMLFRDQEGGYNFWHSGSLCFDTLRRGSFAVLWAGGWGAVAAWDGCIGFEGLVALDRSLAIAALSE